MGDGVKQQISLERANILPKDGKKKPLQYQNDSDINNKQSNDRFSAVEEKLYDTYTSPDVVESNPMLVKRRDSLTPLKLNVITQQSWTISKSLTVS